ncbi:MAG: hypothetical protein CMJ38_01565 [Phycisphaerae bacterium]|nr:hypothetical protein [Phycisphaerae bacterium]
MLIDASAFDRKHKAALERDGLRPMIKIGADGDGADKVCTNLHQVEGDRVCGRIAEGNAPNGKHECFR